MRQNFLAALTRLIIKNPRISVDELAAALRKIGHAPSTLLVASRRELVRSVLRILLEEGLLLSAEADLFPRSPPKLRASRKRHRREMRPPRRISPNRFGSG